MTKSCPSQPVRTLRRTNWADVKLSVVIIYSETAHERVLYIMCQTSAEESNKELTTEGNTFSGTVGVEGSRRYRKIPSTKQDQGICRETTGM
jgi:hypothetical protein